jgi:hypothetical protein
LCGVCGGSNDCIDCTGLVGTTQVDVCGICGGLATSMEDCIYVDEAECSDNTQFIDEQGSMCVDWDGYECAIAEKGWGYSAGGMLDVLKNCPKSCAQCVGMCRDSLSFEDENGDKCRAWRGYDCSLAHVEFGFSPQNEQSLLTNCPFSCGNCQQQEQEDTNDDDADTDQQEETNMDDQTDIDSEHSDVDVDDDVDDDGDDDGDDDNNVVESDETVASTSHDQHFAIGYLGASVAGGGVFFIVALSSWAVCKRKNRTNATMHPRVVVATTVSYSEGEQEQEQAYEAEEAI